MTEDILCKPLVYAPVHRSSAVDNIYISHDPEEAKKFAQDTYHVKKPLEKAAEGSEEEDEEPSTLVDKIRLKVYEFLRKQRQFAA